MKNGQQEMKNNKRSFSILHSSLSLHLTYVKPSSALLPELLHRYRPGLMVWMTFFDANDLPTQIRNWWKLRELDGEAEYYQAKIKAVQTNVEKYWAMIAFGKSLPVKNT